MKNPAFALLNLTLFAFIAALYEKINIFYFLPLIFAIWFKFENFGQNLRRILWLNIFVIFVCASAILSANLPLATLIFLRFNFIVIFLVFLTHNRGEFFLAEGLLGLKFHHKFVSIVFVTIGFINALKSELKRKFRALKARGFGAKFDIFTYKTYANIAAMLIISAFDKASMMQKAMIARGFKGKFIFKKAKFEPNLADFLLFFAILLALFANIFDFGIIFSLD